MNVNIKIPFAEVTLDMDMEHAAELIKQALLYAKDCANDPLPVVNVPAVSFEEPAEAAVTESAANQHTQKPKHGSRAETMFGAKQTWDMPATVSGAGKSTTDEPEAYKGFLYIKCGHCGNVRGFCAKNYLQYHQCECGHKTKLRELTPVFVNCKCGKEFKYRTNLKSQAFTIDCLACGYPVDVELNGKGTAFVTLGDVEA